MIQTVNGLIKKKDIGFCHSHEHLFLAKGVPATIDPNLCLDDYNLTVKEMKRFKRYGGNTIVDAQPLGCGRMEKELVLASNEVGISVIAATGFHKLDFYPRNHWIFDYDVEQLKDVFIHELEKGMFIDTDKEKPLNFIPHKAGFIKIAIDDNRFRDEDKKWFYAAVKASLLTGSPMMCHVESKEQAVYIADFLINNGVKPQKVIICHLDRSLDQLDVHIDLASKGFFLEYDTIGRYKYHNNKEEANLLVYMIDAGIEDSILLGLDTTRARMKSYGAKIGLNHLKEEFIPLLKKKNIKHSVIHKFMTENPGKAFANDKWKGVEK